MRAKEQPTRLLSQLKFTCEVHTRNGQKICSLEPGDPVEQRSQQIVFLVGNDAMSAVLGGVFLPRWNSSQLKSDTTFVGTEDEKLGSSKDLGG